ncbi:hypothetical protein PanWU01x14_213540, partial [Parasponia andersonii]
VIPSHHKALVHLPTTGNDASTSLSALGPARCLFREMGPWVAVLPPSILT